MMSYEEFIETLKKNATAELGYPPEQIVFYPKGYTSEDAQMLNWIRQQNYRCFHEEQDSLMTDFLVFYKTSDLDIENSNILPTRIIYEESQRDYNGAPIHITAKTDMTTEELDKIFKRYAGGYPEIRSELIIRLLNHKLRYHDLQDAVYIRVGDFALVLYQVVSNMDGFFVTSKIKREDLECWGLTDQKDQVMYDALENTARLYPACVYYKDDEDRIDFMNDETFKKEDITDSHNTVQLTTFNHTNGAAALFYPGVVEKFLKLFGKPFIAVFMNVNDVLLFELDDPSVWGYAKTASKSSDMGEMLSGKCYFCDKDGIKLVERGYKVL